MILDGLMNRLFSMGGMYDILLIEWVAIQYHWTLDSPCLYLARPTDLIKYSTDSFIITEYWIANHPNKIFLCERSNTCINSQSPEDSLSKSSSC